MKLKCVARFAYDKCDPWFRRRQARQPRAASYGHENPRSRARTAACVRVCTASFSKIRVRELRPGRLIGQQNVVARVERYERCARNLGRQLLASGEIQRPLMAPLLALATIATLLALDTLVDLSVLS